MAFFSLANSLNFFAGCLELFAKLLRLVAEFLGEWSDIKGEPVFEGTSGQTTDPDFGPLILLIIGLWLGSKYHHWLNRTQETDVTAGAEAPVA